MTLEGGCSIWQRKYAQQYGDTAAAVSQPFGVQASMTQLVVVHMPEDADIAQAARSESRRRLVTSLTRPCKYMMFALWRQRSTCCA